MRGKFEGSQKRDVEKTLAESAVWKSRLQRSSLIASESS